MVGLNKIYFQFIYDLGRHFIVTFHKTGDENT